MVSHFTQGIELHLTNAALCKKLRQSHIVSVCVFQSGEDAIIQFVMLDMALRR